MSRVWCRVVLLDAAGVIALPHRGLVAGALARVGLEIDPGDVAAAHYRAVRSLDRGLGAGGRDPYLRALVLGLGVSGEHVGPAVDALVALADPSRSGEILWSEAAPGALEAIDALRAGGAEVVVVTNSDGHAAGNLRDAGLFAGEVVDSELVGSRKPDPEIFRVALERVGGDGEHAVHVGDSIAADVAGARAVGIEAIHVDPGRACRGMDHRHVRSLAGLARHVAPPAVRAPASRSR